MRVHTDPATPPARRKRKRESHPTCDVDVDDEAIDRSSKKEPLVPPGEKRLRRFRTKPPAAFHDIYHRATTQRFFVLSRARTADREDGDDPGEETVELAGSTGNVYRVVVARQPRCDCPHARAGHQCKHVVYVLARVLRARYDLVYQLALLAGELRHIFAAAPPLKPGGEAEAEGRRKPVEPDCPICFMDLVGAGAGKIVWCRAACGQNMHQECLAMWARTKRQGGWGPQLHVTCPFCRSIWEGDEDMMRQIVKTGKRNPEGYVNVADQLGISQVRDTSSYSPWWSGHAASSYRP